jgi:hypothetical protein
LGWHLLEFYGQGLNLDAYSYECVQVNISVPSLYVREDYFFCVHLNAITVEGLYMFFMNNLLMVKTRISMCFVFGFPHVSFKCQHPLSYNFYMKTKFFKLYEYMIYIQLSLKTITGGNTQSVEYI